MRHRALAAVLLAAAPLAATPVAARAQTSPPYYGFYQTFVAPTSSGPLYLQSIFTTAASMPTGTSLPVYLYAFTGSPTGTGTLTGPALFQANVAATLYQATPITVRPGVLVTPGATYAFAVLGTGYAYDARAAQGGVLQDCEAGGGGIRCTPYAAVGTPSSYAGFVATFGSTPTAVTTPEPATLALTLGGLAALGAAAYRRRA